MNKTLAAVVAALALALLAVPRVVSSITAARVTERVAAINESGYASAEIVAYDSGWFRSNAKIALRFSPAYLAGLAAMTPLASDPAALSERMTIAVNFAHGPVAVLDGVHLGWSKMVAHLDPTQPGIFELQQNLGIPYVFEFRGRTGFTGAMTFDADMPAVDLPVDAARFRFAGATLAGRYSRGYIAADARIPSVEFSSPTGTFSISGVSSSFDGRYVSQYTLPGQGEFAIERLAIVDGTRGTTPVFEANGVAIATDTTLRESGSLLDMRVNYGVGTVRLEDTEVTDAAVGIAMRNIDVAALETYYGSMREVAGGSAPANPAAIAEVLSANLERALAAGPSVAFDPLRFRIAGEAFDGRIELLTNTARLPQAGRLDLENPLFVMGVLDGTAEFSVTKALAQNLAALTARSQLSAAGVQGLDAQRMAEAQAGLMLVQLVGQGLLVDDAGTYRTAIAFKDGTLSVNGSELPLGF